MAFQPAVNCAEVTVRGTQDGQQVENTFYGRFATAYDIVNIQALADAVDNWVGAHWLPALGSNFTYVETAVRGLNASIDLAAESNAHAGSGGITTGVGLPNNCTISVKRTTGFTGRGARGRVFVPGLKDTMLATENVLNVGVASAIVTALNGMRSAMDGVDWTEVILHRVAGGADLPTAVIFTLVEYVMVNLTMDSIRRRLPGRGS